jgi:Carbohydrate family 9 binding domain-like
LSVIFVNGQCLEMTFKIKVFVPLLLLSLSLYSQEKNLRAIKISQPPRIDGDLGDAVWNNAPMATGFTQYYPAAGAAASRETSVKLLYDNTAVYIGAYLYDDPKQIRKQLTARDEEMQKDVDYFAAIGCQARTQSGKRRQLW